MTVYTKTVNEARDYILKRIGAEGSSDYQSLVIEFLNKALIDISQMRDWEYLHAKTTLTISTSDGTASLPADVDRVLSLHEADSDYMLTKLTPYQFEQIKDSSTLTAPRVWTIQGYEQDTSVDTPHIEIEIASIPASGTVYQLRYIRHVDEITASSTDVPNLPPNIWDLVERKATIDALRMTGAKESAYKADVQAYSFALERYLRADKYGSSMHSEISQRADVSAYYRSRFK